MRHCHHRYRFNGRSSGTGLETAPPGEGLAVENTNMYIRQFQRNGTNGFYQVCYDYYSNGELTETQCSVQPW